MPAILTSVVSARGHSQRHFGATHIVFLDGCWLYPLCVIELESLPFAELFLCASRVFQVDCGCGSGSESSPISDFKLPFSDFRTITKRLILGHLERFPQVDGLSRSVAL